MTSFPRPGQVVWIGLRSSRNGSMIAVDRVNVCPETGLDGDHYSSARGKRQISLIQFEHIKVIESLAARDVPAGLLRRNLVVRGINLLALKQSRVRVGQAVIEITGLCHPCSKMEAALGVGGFNAMRGHGGLTARVIQAGTIQIQDPVMPTKTAP